MNCNCNGNCTKHGTCSVIINEDWEATTPTEEELLKALEVVNKANENLRRGTTFWRYPYC